MTRSYHVRRILGLALSLVLSISPVFFSAPQAHASASNWWLKGASFVPSSSDTFASGGFQQAARDFKAAGGTYVNLVVPYYQSNLYSTDMGPGYNTPSDAALAQGIDYLHSIGLHAQVSIYLESYTGEWRAQINPGDRNGWFTNYGNVLNHYASIAQSHGVELYMLGAELVDMASAAQNSDNTARWRTMIASVRVIYHGALTYSANRGQQGWASEVPNIGFWDKLDYVGISAYYELYGDGSVSSMEGVWSSVKGYDVDPVHQKTGKPVIFTEVGYRSLSGAHNQPWNSWDGGSYDAQEQVRDYTALLEFWGGVDYMQGLDLWWWSPDPNYGGAGNIDYTPHNKPAQATLTSWWNGSSTGGPGTTPPPTTTPPAGNAAFTATGSANPSSPAVNQSTTLTANVTDTGDATSGAIVDLELYNGSNRLSQKYFDNQSFAKGASQTYSMPFTPTANGTYTFKVGVFSSGWAKNYVWNDSAATVAVGTSGGGGGSTPPPPPPPSAGNVNVWWPTDNSHVSGVQPFKAMLEGRDVSQYQMYWQVDGGALVQMGNSTQDYPHKESLVDLSSWTWHGGGPYTVNFVAKDSGGGALGSKTVHLLIP